MEVEVVMPKMGESIQEGKILRWMKKPGDRIAKDETILEISTDKVDSEIPSPESGTLVRILVPEQETVAVGTAIAVIETGAPGEARPSSARPAMNSDVRPASPVPSGSPAPAAGFRPPHEEGSRFYSPLVRTIAAKEGISVTELEAIAGTGHNGRLTKHDLLAYLKKRGSGRRMPSHVPPGVAGPDMKELLKRFPAPLYDVRQMDNVQMRMAEHMVRSVQVSPHVGAISECDMTAIAKFRTSEGERFERQEGFKLTYMPFVLFAAARALQEFPLVNASIEGDKIILKKFINLGTAVASPNGLIVPVIKNAEEKNFLGLARAVNDLAGRTRTKKLLPDEIQGGTFTITNYGVFGNLIGTPIINQPQVAILGLGAIQKRAVVVTDREGNDSLAIRSMAYLTLSFDHRLIDGAMGGQFLEQVVENLESFDLTNLF